MTREARTMAGIILLTIPTIQSGGYFLVTSLVDRNSHYMDNALRQNFFRAGHAHAGVFVILSLLCQILADSATLPEPLLVAGAHRSTPRGNFAAGGVFSVDDLSAGRTAQRIGRSHLRGRGISCCRGSDSRYWSSAVTDPVKY